MKFEIKNTPEIDKKRLIIYNSESIGYSVTKSELYDLYCLLREEFKNEENS